MQIIKTLQWNIGGGKIRQGESTADLYVADGLPHIIQILCKYNPHIITLQETHANENKVQAQILSRELGMAYFFNDIYDRSHLEESYGLGQAIVSRFKIEGHNFILFPNPKFETSGPDGCKWISHNKGVSTCTLNFGGTQKLQVKTLHLIPFRKFKVNPLAQELKYLRDDITKKTKATEPLFLLQGDFNYDDFSLKEFLPELFLNGTQEVLLGKPTTPKGRKYDHILYKGLKHISSRVITEALTDHFPVYSEFELTR